MKTEKYTDQIKRLPKDGKQIIGSTDNDNIIVYQAFNSNIANYAIANQKFGGAHYSFNRMTWIKPGFLWMMYRAGWAKKEHQQRILAITLPIVHFKAILQEATITSYDETLFATHDQWKNELAKTEVRLQWDPDHDPYGNKQERKAIQIGLKGGIQKLFCTEWIKKIDDITEFVHQQYQFVEKGENDNIQTPYEEVITLGNAEIEQRIGTTNH